MGYDPELDEVGKMRLIENPKAYIEEYLSRRAKQRELVRKQANEKKEISPIVKRQLNSLKSSLKSNGLRMADITEYLEDE